MIDVKVENNLMGKEPSPARGGGGGGEFGDQKNAREGREWVCGM